MIHLIPPRGKFSAGCQISQSLASLGRAKLTSSCRLASFNHQFSVCTCDLKIQIAAPRRRFSQWRPLRRSTYDLKLQQGKAVFSSRRSHTSFGIPGLESEEGDVKHTPIFSQAVLDHLLPIIRSNSELNIPTRCLDMTFGTGGHTSLILDHGLHISSSLTVVASDRDRASFFESQVMSTRYRTANLIPIQSRFSKLPTKLEHLGIKDFFDAVIIETGISNLQWSDSDRGFCPRRKGILDLRMDDPTDLDKSASASEVLQHIDERGLIRMLKTYGGLKAKARFVAQAILEARYMFHHFQTTQELYDVIGTAARNFCAKASDVSCDERDVRREMMELTVTALRRFVNDEINELDFAVSGVAMPYLKPGSGLLFLIVHSAIEEKVAEKSLKEIDITNQSNKSWSEEEVERLQKRNWQLLEDNMPLKLSAAEKTLHPRFQSASMYIAKRTVNRENVV